MPPRNTARSAATPSAVSSAPVWGSVGESLDVVFGGVSPVVICGVRPVASVDPPPPPLLPPLPPLLPLLPPLPPLPPPPVLPPLLPVAFDVGVDVGVDRVVAVAVVVAVVGVVVGVGVGVAVDVELAVGVAAAHVGLVTVLESNVTAALRASSRPLTVAPVLAVTEVRARIVPANTELVPSVAELPTCQ